MSSVIVQSANAEESGGFLGTSRYGWRVVLFSASGWFFDGYVINVWPLAIPFVMTDLHLTVQDIGIITTIYVAAYTLGTIAGGTFCDYVGRRSVLSFSVLVYMFIDALTALAQGFWTLSIFRFLTGSGTGMELPAGSTFIAEVVNNRWRSRMDAIMGFAYPAGYLVAIAFFATVGAVWGWRAVFICSLLPGIAVFIIRRRLSDSPRFQAALERLKRGEVKRDKVSNITVFRRPYLRDTLPATVYWIGNAFSFWAIGTFIPLYLVKVRQLPVDVELTWFATYQVWAVIIWYLAGWLSDAWARRPAAITLAVLSFLSVWGMTMVPNGAALYILGALGYCLLAGPWIVSFAHSAEIFPTHIRGSGIGTTLGIGRIVSIAAPVVFGALAARYGIGIAFRIGAFFWILTIIGYLLSRETNGIELAQIAGEGLSLPPSLVTPPLQAE